MTEPFIVREALPPALLRMDSPVIVHQRCVNNDQVAIWSAIRWLIAEGGRSRRAISSRMIAPLAKCSIEIVQKHLTWNPEASRDTARRTKKECPTLVQLGLLAIVGYERNGGKHPTPIYEIPAWIELENAAYTLTFLRERASLSAGGPGGPTPVEEQLALFEGTEAERDREYDQGVIGNTIKAKSDDRDYDQGVIGNTIKVNSGDRDHDQVTTGGAAASEPGKGEVCGSPMHYFAPSTPNSDARGDRDYDHPPDRNPDHRLDRDHDRVVSELGQDVVVGAPTRATPPAPAGHPPIPAPPLEMWAEVWCANHSEPPPGLHQHQLDAMAASWDLISAGHGNYWVGRAVLEAGFAGEAPRSLSLVRWVLDRWEALAPEEWGSRVYQLQVKEQRRERSTGRQEQQPPRERQRHGGDAQRAPAYGQAMGDGRRKIEIVGRPADS